MEVEWEQMKAPELELEESEVWGAWVGAEEPELELKVPELEFELELELEFELEL